MGVGQLPGDRMGLWMGKGLSIWYSDCWYTVRLRAASISWTLFARIRGRIDQVPSASLSRCLTWGVSLVPEPVTIYPQVFCLLFSVYFVEGWKSFLVPDVMQFQWF